MTTTMEFARLRQENKKLLELLGETHEFATAVWQALEALYGADWPEEKVIPVSLLPLDRQVLFNELLESAPYVEEKLAKCLNEIKLEEVP